MFAQVLFQSKLQRILQSIRIRKCDVEIMMTFTFREAGEGCGRKLEGKTEQASAHTQTYTHARTHVHAQTRISLSLSLSLCTQRRSFTSVPLFLFLRLSANYCPEGRGFTVRGWRENERRKRERKELVNRRAFQSDSQRHGGAGN